MKAIRCLFVAMLFAVSGALSPVLATSFTTDQSDLWWNPNESGWGIQFVQRGTVIFATMFVYDQTKTPIWYSATLTSAGGLTWTGDLVLTSGPWLGTVPFNPNTVTVRKVGTMTWTAQTVQGGILSYSVDGTGVSKSLVRQFIATDDYSGTFLGVLHGVSTSCFNPASNGTFEELGGFTITPNGPTVAIQFAGQNGTTCAFSGQLTQGGQFGQMSGLYSCSTSEIGSFAMFEMAVGINTIGGRYTLSSSNLGCQSVGYFGGARHR